MNPKVLTFVIAALVPCSLFSAEKIKVLIADGPQKAHNHVESTPVLQQILDKADRFEVDHSRSTKESCADGSYKPDFSKYDVVVMNEGFGAADWPEATRKAFEEYMAGGGGMVSIHAANNCWPNWETNGQGLGRSTQR